MTNDQIRAVFLANGFTVKEGQTDLKPYVYAAARALLALATHAPAQPDPWHDAVLAECMAIEGAYKSDDPTGTLRSLIDWHVMNERHPSRAAAPAEGEDKRLKDILRATGYLTNAQAWECAEAILAAAPKEKP